MTTVAQDRLAQSLRRLKSLPGDAWIDLRYGGRLLAGSTPSRFRERGASHTVNSSYGALRSIFEHVSIQPSDVLVDVGCGKGRVLNWWLSQGLTNPLIGIELDSDVSAVVRRRLRGYANVRILSGSVLDVLPAHGTIFYLYNPFGEPTLLELKARIEAECRRSVTLIYYNPRYIGAFSRDHRWVVSELAANPAARAEHRTAICRYTCPDQ